MSNLTNSDIENIWHPFTQQWDLKPNIVVEKAEGVWLYTDDGRKILDAVSSWWVNLYGHANPVVAKAIADQAQTLEHVIFAGFTHKPAITMCEKLLGILPDNQDKIFFSDNGSTSVEVALKMAFQYWFNKDKPKKRVIAIEGSYHGDTFGAMAVAERNAFSKPFDDFLFEVDFLPFPNGDNDEEVIARFERILATGEVASFIFEPLLQGTAGMRTYSIATLNKLISLAQEKEVICIADEVMTGFGRTGKNFASLHLDVQPDIFCMSKGITAGFMALGLTSCSKKIHEGFVDEDKLKTFFHGHSYTGNALACAAANASLDLLVSDEMQSNIDRISKKHEEFENRLWQSDLANQITGISRLGTVISIEIKTDNQTSYFNNLRDTLYNAFLEQDILLRPLGNVIYIISPYVIKDEELEFLYQRIMSTLSSVLK